MERCTNLAYKRPRVNPATKAASRTARRVARTILGERPARWMSEWIEVWSANAPFEGADGGGQSAGSDGDSGGAAGPGGDAIGPGGVGAGGPPGAPDRPPCNRARNAPPPSAPVLDRSSRLPARG